MIKEYGTLSLLLTSVLLFLREKKTSCELLVRIELFGEEVESIRYLDPLTGEILEDLEAINIYPAKHFVTPKDRLGLAIKAIRKELKEISRDP